MREHFYFENETNSGTQLIDVQTRHFTNRKIFITGQFDDEMAYNFMVQFIHLDREKGPIDIIINSNGGLVNAGLVIYDLIHGSKNVINTYCVGKAQSMAAIILAAGKKGHRFILPHSSVMVHGPQLFSQSFGGSVSSIKQVTEEMLKIKLQVNTILSEHTGKTIEELDIITDDDYCMDAEEAIKFGIVDKIITHIN